MTTATLIQRMSKNLKWEAISAMSKINLDGYTVNLDTRTIEDDENVYGIWFYRCGDEVIAVPDFYIGEEGVDLTGSQGGDYELTYEEVTKC